MAARAAGQRREAGSNGALIENAARESDPIGTHGQNGVSAWTALSRAVPWSRRVEPRPLLPTVNGASGASAQSARIAANGRNVPNGLNGLIVRNGPSGKNATLPRKARAGPDKDGADVGVDAGIVAPREKAARAKPFHKRQ